MIKYNFICNFQHTFEAWFKNFDSFEEQFKNKLIMCPICDSYEIKKQFSVPSLVSSSSLDGNKSNIKEKEIVLSNSRTDVEKINEAMNSIKKFIYNNFKNVGDNFKEVALEMHKSKINKENIYGNASLEDIKELQEEGIEVAYIPVVDTKKLN